MNVTGITQERLTQMRFIYVDEQLRAYVNEDGIRTIAAHDAIVSRLKSARDQAHHDALKHLSRGRFIKFGERAAAFVSLTKILGDRRAEFFEFVLKARESLLCGGKK
jgi:hypothetical protein